MKGLRWSRWYLAGLSLILTACPLLSYTPAIPPVLPVMYKANGVCQGVMVTNHVEDSKWSIGKAAEPPILEATPLPAGQAVRIPDPQPFPETTRYTIRKHKAEEAVGSKFLVDLTWRCLPDKPPERVQFQKINETSNLEGLVIDEDASLPSGLRIMREKRSRW